MWTSLWTLSNAVCCAAAEAGEAADPTGGQTTQPQSPFGGNMWIIFVIFAGMFYFLMFRPQQKRDKERREMLSSLSKGDSVVTNGGICGTVVGLTEKSVVLRVSDEPPVKMEFLRGAVARVTPKEGDRDE